MARIDKELTSTKTLKIKMCSDCECLGTVLSQER
jgi:hypothetical protein